jgi:hypothetical protein
MRAKDLIEVLTVLRETLPTLTRISAYERAQTMMRKSESGMIEEQRRLISQPENI